MLHATLIFLIRYGLKCGYFIMTFYSWVFITSWMCWLVTEFPFMTRWNTSSLLDIKIIHEPSPNCTSLWEIEWYGIRVPITKWLIKVEFKHKIRWLCAFSMLPVHELLCEGECCTIKTIHEPSPNILRIRDT